MCLTRSVLVRGRWCYVVILTKVLSALQGDQLLPEDSSADSIDTIDFFRKLCTFKFNKALRPLLASGGFDQSTKKLVGQVVAQLRPNLNAIDFASVVSAVSGFRTGEKQKLLCSQRVRDVKGYIRTDLNKALQKLEAGGALLPVPAVLSEKTLSKYPPFKAIQDVYSKTTGGAFPTIEYTVLGLIEVGEILEVSTVTLASLLLSLTTFGVAGPPQVEGRCRQQQEREAGGAVTSPDGQPCPLHEG